MEMEQKNSAICRFGRGPSSQKDQKRQNDPVIKNDASHSSILDKWTINCPAESTNWIIHDSYMDEKMSYAEHLIKPIGLGIKVLDFGTVLILMKE
jgi:hypothetical protein